MLAAFALTVSPYSRAAPIRLYSERDTEQLCAFYAFFCGVILPAPDLFPPTLSFPPRWLEGPPSAFIANTVPCRHAVVSTWLGAVKTDNAGVDSNCEREYQQQQTDWWLVGKTTQL